MLVVIVAFVLMAAILPFNNGEFNISFVSQAILISAIIMAISILSKKLAAYYIDVEIEHKIWEFQRYGLSTKSHFRRPFPIGLILPLLLAIITGGLLKFLAFLQFEARALPAKAVKKFGGGSRFSGICEWDDAIIVFYGVLPLLILASLASFFASPFLISFSKFSVIFAISNLIPISKLDGSKLLFGSRPLFVFTWLLVIIAGITVLV